LSLEVESPPRRGRDVARDAEGGSYLQTLLVSAVASLLVTRAYLEATGYPRVGSGNLHIAHMLWGGLLMLAALVLMLALLGRATKRIAAVVGGAGFGLFVDELGKFVTTDNDYFFQPTIALIYVLLVGLFLLFRVVERRSLSSDELVANAADGVRELVLGGATGVEVERVSGLLARSGVEGPLAEAIRGAARAAGVVNTRPSWRGRVAERSRNIYEALIELAWFQRVVLLLFAGQAVAGMAFMVLATQADPSTPLGRLGVPGMAPPAASGGAGLASASASAAMVAIGVAALARGARLTGYRWFERSVLVAVLVTQVILFWHDQLAAIGGLAWNLVLLSVVRYLIRREIVRGT
jgi:hypothetical protein